MAIKIFIDQGHNPTGHNTGAESFGVKEQDVTYQVGVYLADMLRSTGILKSGFRETRRRKSWERATVQV